MFLKTSQVKQFVENCVPSGTSPKRLKIQACYSADSNACLDSTERYELQELRGSGTESEGDCSNTEVIYSGDGDDRDLEDQVTTKVLQ